MANPNQPNIDEKLDAPVAPSQDGELSETETEKVTGGGAIGIAGRPDTGAGE